MANLAVANASRIKTNAKPVRAIVRAAAQKVATKGKDVAKRAGSAVVRGTAKGGAAIIRGTAKGGAIVARSAVRGGRAIGRAVKENWKTAALHEGVSLTSHVATYFADRKAKAGYLKALDGMPFLQSLAKPSTIIAVLELVGVIFTKGSTRAVLRETLRGTVHSKTGSALHEMFPMESGVQVRGIEDESLAGQDLKDESLAGQELEDESLAGQELEDESLAGQELEDESLAGQELEDESLAGQDLEEMLAGQELDEETRAG